MLRWHTLEQILIQEQQKVLKLNQTSAKKKIKMIFLNFIVIEK